MEYVFAEDFDHDFEFGSPPHSRPRKFYASPQRKYSRSADDLVLVRDRVQITESSFEHPHVGQAITFDSKKSRQKALSGIRSKYRGCMEDLRSIAAALHQKGELEYSALGQKIEDAAFKINVWAMESNLDVMDDFSSAGNDCIRLVQESLGQCFDLVEILGSACGNVTLRNLQTPTVDTYEDNYVPWTGELVSEPDETVEA
jgi:hypothetical protein